MATRTTSKAILTSLGLGLGSAHVGELHARLVLVEQVGEGAREDALDGLHLVRGRVRVRVRARWSSPGKQRESVAN